MASKSETTYNAPVQDPTVSWPQKYSYVNGSQEELLARFAVQELCLSWPVFRDHSRWEEYKSCFTEDAQLYTTWSSGQSINGFIKVSKEGRANGDFIMHEGNGARATVNLAADRGVGTLKTTITQRFVKDGIAVDVTCNNTFFYFCLRDEQKDWKIHYYKVIYEKDRVAPVDGKTLPNGVFENELLKNYPEGYQFLAAAQEKIAGHNIDTSLPTYGNGGFERMYEAMGTWLAGNSVDLTKV